ncbi:hypothetical protein SDC9_131604 [bioreactor metagenome]|uniref:Uncharacterized protein n=1 Tax=bioreactor metagenome TaxID=1076179 RepID=A0A645D5L4_9ZZZZ
MRKAVQHALSLGDLRGDNAVVFLVEEETRLLPVFHVHGVVDAVFDDLNQRTRRLRQKFRAVPAFFELQPFQLANGYLVALEDAANRNPVLLEQRNKQAIERSLDPLNADGEHLTDQHVVVAVNRQPR